MGEGRDKTMGEPDAGPSGQGAGAGEAPRRLRIANSFAVTNVGPFASKHRLTSYGAMQTLFFTDPDLTLRPWVASSAEPNGQAGWTIRLHPTARLHDGQAIDAAVVRECIERHLGSGVCVPSLERARWEIPDSRTLRVTTSEPDRLDRAPAGPRWRAAPCVDRSRWRNMCSYRDERRL
jgi:ABC-type transport system substrate-binding protein